MLPYPEEIGDTVGVYYLLLLPSIFTVRNEVPKVIFYRCVSVHRGLLSQHALQQVSRWGLGIPACLAGFQAHSQGGSLGICPVGRSPGPHSRWKLEGSGPGPQPRGKLRGSSPGPHSRGKLGGSGRGPQPRGKLRGSSPGPHSRGKLRGSGPGPQPRGEVEGDQVQACSQGGS